MMILGITGGVGVGKSTVLQILEKQHGFCCLLADEAAKKLMNEDPHCRELLRKAFGDVIFNADGHINKTVYAGLIYTNEEARRRSDEIVHPLTWQYIRQCADAAGKMPGARLVIETALPGKQLRELCDTVWCVQADPDVRIERLMASRGYTKEKCRRMMEAQLSDAAFRAYADFVLDNSKSAEETEALIAAELSRYGI